MAMGAWFVPLSTVLDAHGLQSIKPLAFATSATAAFVSPLLFATMADRHLGAVRVLDGITDGEYFGQWGPAADMGQPVFNAPSVFNFYPPDFPLPGSSLVAPQFGIHNANTALARINFANDLVYWWYNKGQGLAANPTIGNATGTRVSYANWENQLVDPARDSATVVEQLNQLLMAGRLSAADKQVIVAAMNSWTPADTWLTGADTLSNWKRERVKTAVYLMMASPQYQVQQ